MKEFDLIITENIPSFALNAIHIALGIEGGNVDDSQDRGGKTNFGISDLRDGVADGLIDIDLDGIGDIDPENLTRDQAIAIYYRDYWLANSCHLLPHYIALMVFDCAVNQGGTFARKTLQRISGTAPDGIVGGLTLASADNVHEYSFIWDYTQARIQRYNQLCKEDLGQLKYIDGWVNRAFKVGFEAYHYFAFGGEK